MLETIPRTMTKHKETHYEVELYRERRWVSLLVFPEFNTFNQALKHIKNSWAADLKLKTRIIKVVHTTTRNVIKRNGGKKK